MKKLLSVLLSLVFVFAMCVPAFATDGAAQEAYTGDPIVVVRGIDFAGLVREDGSKALKFNFGDILTSLVSKVSARTFAGDRTPGVSGIIDLAVELFDPIACDKEGNPKHADVHIPKFPESAAHYDLSGDEWADTAVGLYRSIAYKFGGENTYLYTFDWRKTPKDLAAELNDLITKVKADTGSEKVDIAACSMGGMITTAYLDEYGTDSIDNLVFFSSAHNGGDLVGSAFTGDLKIDADALGEFLLSKVNNFLKFAVNGLIKLGVVKGITNFANNFINDNKDKLYDEFLRVSLGTAYGLWALIPDEYFDSAIELFFGDCKDEYAVALTKIYEIREFVNSTEDILAEASEKITISYVSHYNSLQLPIYSNFEMHGDGVLESKRTSGYATFAKYGQTLPVDSVNEFISPDKVIDASTCLYPESTWFVKNAKHVGCKDGSQHTEFAIWLITRDEQPTVTMNPAYPRFMNVDGNENFIGF